MDLNYLVSTMDQKNKSLIHIMNIRSDAVVVNQIKDGNENTLKYDENSHRVTWIDIDEKGLSKSRNLALRNSENSISVLADDDLIYLDNTHEIIHKAFNQYDEADIICFQVRGIERKFKNYSAKVKKLNFFSAMKVSSVEIAFRTRSIKNANIKFDEDFGAGSKYIMGEENIFLSQALKKGLKIYYVPEVIADLHLGDSSWFQGYNELFFISRGASFYKMNKTLSIILILQWAIRKRKLYKESSSLINAVKLMIKGKNEVKSKEMLVN